MVDLLIIFAFLAVLLRDAVETPIFYADLPNAAVWLLGIFPFAVAWSLVHIRTWQIARAIDRTGRADLVGRADRLQFHLRLIATFLLAANVFLFGWLDAIRLLIGDVIALDEIIALLPLLMTYAAGWWSLYPVDRRLKEAVLLRRLERGDVVQSLVSRPRFVLDQMRNQVALILVPFLGILIWGEAIQRVATWLWGWNRPVGEAALLRWFDPESGSAFARFIMQEETAAGLMLAAQLIGAFGVFALIPALLRHLWDTAPLAQSQLRERLLDICRAHRVRVRELLVWHTNGWTLNGAVIGLLAPLRYILLSDALLEQLHEDEIEAVTAHEVAHIRCRHMPWLVLSLMAGAGLTGAIGILTLSLFVEPDDFPRWIGGLMGLVSSIAGLITLGFVSRRFEWQADAFAAAHLSTPGPERHEYTIAGVSAMIAALGKVADLNFVPRSRWSWRHGSITTRQERLRALIGTSCKAAPINRTASIVKGMIAFALLTLVAALLVESGAFA